MMIISRASEALVWDHFWCGDAADSIDGVALNAAETKASKVLSKNYLLPNPTPPSEMREMYKQNHTTLLLSLKSKRHRGLSVRQEDWAAL